MSSCRSTRRSLRNLLTHSVAPGYSVCMEDTLDKWSEELADKIVGLFEARDETLTDIRDMGREIQRIEGLRLQWIIRARRLGVPAQQVADAAGISRQQVYRITGRIED